MYATYAQSIQYTAFLNPNVYLILETICCHSAHCASVYRMCE